LLKQEEGGYLKLNPKKRERVRDREGKGRKQREQK